jgi:hypothetical protein
VIKRNNRDLEEEEISENEINTKSINQKSNLGKRTRKLEGS